MVKTMNNQKNAIIRSVSEYLPSDISSVLLSLDSERVQKLCEIRIKSDLPVVLIFTDGVYYITHGMRLTRFSGTDLLSSDKNTLSEVFSKMCRFSVYSYTEQINRGFLSLPEGVRVGVYGIAVTENDKIVSVRNIRGVNIRIPIAFNGCSAEISDLFQSDKLPGTVICGPPSSGKTTVLKDLCRMLSDELGKKVCVIDERFEFETEYTGKNTDILSGYPKHLGIEIAVRTLSPDVIILDEIGMNGEAEKIIECMNSGVCFIMSMHCSDKIELYRRNQFRILMSDGVIDYCVFLKNKCEIEEIVSVEEILNETDRTDNTGTLSCSYRTLSFGEVEKTG